MLEINGKTLMNLQEAVQWLLNNNALPFQANVSYVANTEIAKSAIINPSPISIKVGALVLFADSKIGTVSAVSSNSFMVGSEYTDIKTALNYISNVQINASQHLIVTFSDGTTKDAGLIKQISSFSINASQHLIANFNDGTSQDLGAIFSGNITISGNLTVTGQINGVSSPSVKPIYYHGINLETSTFSAILTMTILDNSYNTYNATRLRQWITDIVNNTGGLLIACNGNLRDYVDVNENQRSGHVVAIFTNATLMAEEKLQITMVNDSGVKSVVTTTLTDFFATFTLVGDKVNKIN